MQLCKSTRLVMILLMALVMSWTVSAFAFVLEPDPSAREQLISSVFSSYVEQKHCVEKSLASKEHHHTDDSKHHTQQVLSKDCLQQNVQNTSTQYQHFACADCLGLQCHVMTYDVNPAVDVQIATAQNFQQYSPHLHYPDFYSLDFRQDILRPPQSSS